MYVTVCVCVCVCVSKMDLTMEHVKTKFEIYSSNQPFYTSDVGK
jgi:hypothetical protein